MSQFGPHASAHALIAYVFKAHGRRAALNTYVFKGGGANGRLNSSNCEKAHLHMMAEVLHMHRTHALCAA